ncbi:MAG TPA: flagellar biosynthesis protein FliQ [Oligoflexia bacterium]|nr:flagellar biosynthesis protein FliQ [Oligoflexia bacterium]
MSEDLILGIGHEALKVAIFLAGPILLVAMIVGIAISMLQAVTQINEATLSFVPKILAISIVLVVTAPWMIETITTYTTELIQQIPDYIANN